MQRHEPQRPDVGRRLGDHLLDHLLLDEQLTLGAATDRPLAHHVERRLALADPPHRVVDAPAVEPLLREHEAVALGADAVGDGDPAVAQEDLGVPAGSEVARGTGGAC